MTTFIETKLMKLYDCIIYFFYKIIILYGKIKRQTCSSNTIKWEHEELKARTGAGAWGIGGKV